MVKKQKFLTYIVVCITLFVFNGTSEEIIIKKNIFDKTPYWKYLFDADDGSQVFFCDGKIQRFWFKKGTKEATFELDNPSFMVSPRELATGFDYAINRYELFATYNFRCIEEEKEKSYVYRIFGLNRVAQPFIESLGSFSKDNAIYCYVIKLRSYFVALIYEDLIKKMEIYDNYKRPVANFPVFPTTISLCYSEKRNAFYFVNPDGLLTELPLETLQPNTFAFEGSLPTINTALMGSMPLLKIFAKDSTVNQVYYALPGSYETRTVFIMEADLSRKIVRNVATLTGNTSTIVEVNQFNERYVLVSFFAPPKTETTRFFLFDITAKEYIPLKGMFYANPKWSITLERLNSTPYQVESSINEEGDYRFIFFENQALDETLLQRIKK